MSNILTDARTALLAAIQGDSSINDLVRTWFPFNRSLLQRFEIERSVCTAYALHPGSTHTPREDYNAAYDLIQPIIAVITTDGQCPDPCEELVMLTITRAYAERAAMLGLAAQGLANISIARAEMIMFPDEKSARVMWQADVQIDLKWILWS